MAIGKGEAHMLIQNARVWTERDGFVCADVAFSNMIEAVGTLDSLEPALDAQGRYLVPGFVDIHVHGGMRADFSDADAEGNARVARRLLQHGVTSYLATTMTMPEETLLDAAGSFDFASEDASMASCLGLHLEGPFLSYKKRGAQCAEYLHAADLAMLERIDARSGGNVRLVAVAPEIDGAMAFIEEASKRVIVSLAHTTADYDTAMEAFSRGASHVTHLFNAMEPFLHRAPGVVGAARDAGAVVELICDGLHIHPSVVRATFALFPGRVALVSDAVRSAGMPDGTYTLGGQEITLRDGKSTLADGTLAGANGTMHDALVNAVRFGIPLADAVAAAALVPARSVGIDAQVGSIEPGKRADFVLLNEDLSIRAVFHLGQSAPLR